MPKALVSIIIPTFNYAPYLPNLFRNLQAQTYKDLEVIVVDDGSTDDTKTLVQTNCPKATYIYQENQGLSAARNTGIRAAHGEYLIFLDADDFLAPNVVSSQVANLETHPNLDLSICLALGTFIQDSKAQSFIWPLMADNFDLHLCCTNINPVHSFCLRHAKIDLVGFFKKDRHLEDYDFWLRCAEMGLNFATNITAAVFYNKHADSLLHAGQKQLKQTIALRQELRHCLETKPNFPKAGKLCGWLAYLAGCVKEIHNYPDTPEIADFWQEIAIAQENISLYAPTINHLGQYYALEALNAWQLLAAKAKTRCPNLPTLMAKFLPDLTNFSELKRLLKNHKLTLCCDDQAMRQTAQAAVLWLNHFLFATK